VKQEKTYWHRVSILNQGLAKVANDYLKKGSAVLVEGSMEYRNYTDGDGVKWQAAEVVLRPYAGQIIMLGDRKSSGPV
jgi:single-strand DNA-binding protein